MTSKKFVYVKGCEGSLATIGFNPKKETEKFLSIGFMDNHMLLNSTDKPIDGQYCAKLDKRRAHVPQAIIEAYEEFAATHPCDNGNENVRVFMKKRPEFEFVFPEGTTYSTCDEPCFEIPSEQKFTISVTDKSSLFSKLKRLENEFWNVIMYLSDKKAYCLIQKSNSPLFPDISELRRWFGRNLSFFYQGVMKYSCRNLVLPTAFYDAVNINTRNANSILIRGSETEGFYVVTPEFENCIVDDAIIDTTEFVGAETTMCEECFKLPLDEAKDVVMQLLRSAVAVTKENNELKKLQKEISALTKRNKELEEENDRLLKLSLSLKSLSNISDF